MYNRLKSWWGRIGLSLLRSSIFTWVGRFRSEMSSPWACYTAGGRTDAVAKATHSARGGASSGGRHSLRSRRTQMRNACEAFLRDASRARCRPRLTLLPAIPITAAGKKKKKSFHPQRQRTASADTVEARRLVWKLAEAKESVAKFEGKNPEWQEAFQGRGGASPLKRSRGGATPFIDFRGAIHSVSTQC